jgi:hypothetical protein
MPVKYQKKRGVAEDLVSIKMWWSVLLVEESGVTIESG